MKTEDTNGIPFKDHIESMKFREQELRDKADLFIVRADVIQKERLELEHFLDRLQKQNQSPQEKLRSLVQ